MDSACEVAIIGAGPYGLSAAAHLRAAGVETRIFGRPMAFWEQQMPAGMLLRSSWEASQLCDPDNQLTLERYEGANHTVLARPLALSDFVAYGRWFKDQVAPDTDSRQVAMLERAGAGFQLQLEDGERVESSKVVVATGISHHAWRPAEFADMPAALVTHSSQHGDLSSFAGRHVAVIGAGHSAIESAALLSESDAQVEVVMRAPAVRWLTESSRHSLPRWLRQILYHRTDAGPALLSQIIAHPALFRLLSRGAQDKIARRATLPAASSWLRPRIAGVRFTPSRRVSQVRTWRDGVSLHLDNDAVVKVDHVLLATGYRVDISRCRFLGPKLLHSIKRVNGSPALKAGFESSVAGLHFIGALAAYSFGPLLRFVSGAGYAARAVTGSVTISSQYAYSPTATDCRTSAMASSEAYRRLRY